MPSFLDDVSGWIQVTLGLGPEMQRKLAVSLAVIVLLWLVRRLVLHVAYGRLEDPHARYRWRKSTTYVAVALGILVVGRIWFQAFGSVATFLGLLSAGLAIALRDLVADLAGWAFIVWRRPFEVGDRVQIGEHAGDVVDIRIFQFSLLEIGNWVHADQSTGRLLHIPNARVLSEPVANYAKPFPYIWHEIPVLITFESDWRKAKAILARIVQEEAGVLSQEAQRRVLEASRRFLVFYTKLTPIVYTSVEESGVLLTLRLLCEPRQRRGVTEAIWERVLDEFGRADDIDFAYPTRRLFDNVLEGKLGVRASPPPTIPRP